MLGRGKIINPYPGNHQQKKCNRKYPHREAGRRFLQTHVDIEEVCRAGHEGPGLLRIPRPVVSPRILCPRFEMQVFTNELHSN